MQRHLTNTLRPRRARRFAALLALIALVLIAWGCDDAKVSDPNNSPGDKTPDPYQGKTDEFGHGPDDDAVVVESGALTGDWRVVYAMDNSLFVNLTLIQEAGDANLDGYFSMSMTAGNDAAEVGGDLLEGSKIDGEELLIKWNPTKTPEEVYTIEATRVDENTYQGTVSAKLYEELNQAVQITRYEAPPSQDEDLGTSADTIDAGPQGGAGL